MGSHPRGWSRPFVWAEGAGHVGPGLSELSWGPAEQPAPLLRPRHASSKVQRPPVTSRPQAVWLTAPPYPVPVYFVFLLPGTPDCSHPFLPSAVLRCTVRVASALTLSDEHPHSLLLLPCTLCLPCGRKKGLLLSPLLRPLALQARCREGTRARRRCPAALVGVQTSGQASVLHSPARPSTHGLSVSWHRRRCSLLIADAKLEYSRSMFKVKV